MKNKIYEDISDEELKSITSVIKMKYGIDFTNYEAKSLKRGFGRVISKNGLKSVLELWKVILRDRNFFLSCIDQLTVNLTELFRNPKVWERIYSLFVEEYQQSDKIKIWNAGCSTGEEVYAVSYIIHLLSFENKASILATDLNTSVIEQAITGEYVSFLTKKYERNFVEAFQNNKVSSFLEKKENGGLSVKQKYKDNIIFKEHNLVSSPYPERMNVIFCRNVMIYFDERLKIKVLRKIHKALLPGGFLIVGFYDLLPESAKDLFEIYDSKSKIYRKI